MNPTIIERPTTSTSPKDSEISMSDTLMMMLNTMFEGLIKQTKKDESETIGLLTDKFTTQITQLNDSDASLQCKVAILEEKLANT